jgi:hypothetical protein
MSHAYRRARSAPRRAAPFPPDILTLRNLATECIINDVLREIHVIGNPAFPSGKTNPGRLARE